MTYIRLVDVNRPGGKDPVKRFPDNSTLCRADNADMADGSVPDSWLSCTTKCLIASTKYTDTGNAWRLRQLGCSGGRENQTKGEANTSCHCSYRSDTRAPRPVGKAPLNKLTLSSSRNTLKRAV